MGFLSLYNTVIYDNTNDGIYDVFTNHMTIHNSVIGNNGGYGINTPVSGGTLQGGHNCWYNNTSGNVHSNLNGGNIPGYGNVTSDPQFNSLVTGSEDYRITDSSPLWGAGEGYEGP